MQDLKAEYTNLKVNLINVNGNLIDLTTPKIMGIINLTDDSFYEISRLKSDKQLLTVAEKMLREGATFLDIGTSSTRPGAKVVDVTAEISRLKHGISCIKKTFPEAMISVDTFRSELAQIAIDYGAGIINDISGFGFDPLIVKVASRYNVPYILTHLRGSFDTMHDPYIYEDITNEVICYFHQKISMLLNEGIHDIIIDPGFGFSKSLSQNYELLHEMDKLCILNRPILAGVSRKSMIYKKLEVTANESLNGTTVLNTLAITKGASILRVHDVAPAMEIIRLLY